MRPGALSVHAHRDDPEALALWREEMTGEPHRPKKDESGNNVTASRRITGNSRAYLLSRLKRERSDLLR